MAKLEAQHIAAAQEKFNRGRVGGRGFQRIASSQQPLASLTTSMSSSSSSTAVPASGPSQEVPVAGATEPVTKVDEKTEDDTSAEHVNEV